MQRGCAVGLNTQQIACQQLWHKRQRIVADRIIPWCTYSAARSGIRDDKKGDKV